MFTTDIIKAAYLGSFVSATACPVLQLPEYAFVGRSNVGKSSLINMLSNRKDLARVSNQPGKTRTINLYDMDSSWILADLPGYGYAQVAKSMKKSWPAMIFDYLMKRENLMCAFVLLDFRLPLQQIDHEFITELGNHDIPFALVYTKVDKVSRSEKETHARRIESVLLEDWNELPPRFHTSEVTKEGRDVLLQYIGEMNVHAGKSGPV
jgi:GTP-binding protein